MRQSQCWAEASERMQAEYRQRRCYRAAGRSEAQVLRRRVKAGAVVEPYPLLFAHASTWSELRAGERHRYLARTLVAVHHRLIFCVFTAALMWGLPVSYRLLGRLHAYTNPQAPSQSTAFMRRHALVPNVVSNADGVPVASMAEAAVDCLRMASFCDGMAIADGLLRALGTDRDALAELVERFGRGRHGINRARDVAAYADGRAESGGESVARAVMIEAGVPPTDLQPEFRDPVEPWRVVRPDYLFVRRDGVRVLGELDGLDKYDMPALTHGRETTEILVQERQRESHLTLLGMPVVRFTMKDVRTPGRLRYLLSAAGVTPETIARPDYRAR